MKNETIEEWEARQLKYQAETDAKYERKAYRYTIENKYAYKCPCGSQLAWHSPNAIETHNKTKHHNDIMLKLSQRTASCNPAGSHQ